MNHSLDHQQTSTASPVNFMMTTWDWLKLGIRLAAFMPAKPSEARGHSTGMTAWQFLGIAALVVFISLSLQRLAIVGRADFEAQGAALQWIPFAISALLLWLALDKQTPNESQANKVGSALGLLMVGAIVWGMPLSVFSLIYAHLPMGYFKQSIASFWTALYWITLAWGCIASLRVYHWLGMPVRRAFLLCFASLGMPVIVQSYWYATAWQTAYDDSASSQPRFVLNQEQFEKQAALLTQQTSSLAAQISGKRDVYAVMYAPYASENVFMNEAKMVQEVLENRFGSTARIITLINHPATTSTHAWATPANLQRSLQAIGKLADPEEDVVMVYATSHGASNFKLASSHWPLQIEDLSPAKLADMLNQASIKNRILAISACYSGGWIEPLKSDHSLVMTAADANNTSFGCGKLSELTYFGRAVFDENLRNTTRSFEEAFKSAVPVIKQREDQGGKTDGFSNPQIHVGSAIRPILAELEKQTP
jgi:Peptidase C13 family